MPDFGTQNMSYSRVAMVDTVTGLPITPSNGVAAGVADSGNPMKVGGKYNATAPTLTDGFRGDLQLDSRGNVKVGIWNADGTAGMDVAAAAGADGSSNTVDVLLARAYGMKHNGASWDRDRKANAASRIPSSAATNNATVAKASAGEVHHINGFNATAGVKYLKLFNKATAPDPSADTPFQTLALPASSTFQFNFPGGLYFSTGIGYALVTGAADLNNTAVAAADVLGLNVTYA